MERKSECIPAMFRKEHPIEIRDDVSFSAFSSDGEVGIMLAPGEADFEVKADEAAFLFGSDKDELYFMPHFGLFFKCELESDEEAAVSKLYNGQIGVYKNCSMIKAIRVNARVYRDALDMIPLGQPKEREAGKGAAMDDPPRIQWILSDDEVSDEEIEKEVGEHLEATGEMYAEIRGAVDKEIEMFKGRVLVRYRPGSARLYSYDVVEVNRRLIIVVYAEFTGKWLADEESFCGDPPQWFSEDDDHRASPVLQAMRCRDFFGHEIPNANIASIVVLPQGCAIINGEEMSKVWRDDCGTEIVRTTRIDGTMIQALHEYLAAQPAEDSKVPEFEEVELLGISNRFAMNPDNWIDKE